MNLGPLLSVVDSFIVSFAAFCHFFASMWSYKDLYNWHVAGNNEKPFKTFLGLIARLKHIKMENVQKIRHLELIQWWYL